MGSRDRRSTSHAAQSEIVRRAECATVPFLRLAGCRGRRRDGPARHQRLDEAHLYGDFMLGVGSRGGAVLAQGPRQER
jgi:hypothetical protein